MPKNTFYITTSIAYVNAKPHLGFAMESIQADVLSRYCRKKGKEVCFLTGTDEHGSKMHQTAKDLGIEVQELADQNAEKFKELKNILNLSNDDFIRTSSDRHKKGAQKLWQKLVAAGDIYKSNYQGFYCVGCENFVTEKELVDGKCPNHLKKPEALSEENYFFRLSKYSEEIGRKIESGELKIVPEFRKNEILNIVKEGLTDVSFSRPKKVLGWGVPVPDDSAQTMYVWCDALSNYITAIDYEKESELFQKFWPADVHLIGKDIIRFHAGIWIGMLMSVKLPLPKAIYVHGFITSEGQKMSKSLGNVADPAEMAREYGIDALRYYLLKEIPTCDDGDFSRERFKALYDSDLANNLGNLLNRVVAMGLKYAGNGGWRMEDGEIADAKAQEMQRRREIREEEIIGELKIEEIAREYERAVEEFDLRKALEAVFKIVDGANLHIDQKKPWELAKKGEKEELAKVMNELLLMLAVVADLLAPFLPETAEKMRKQLGASEKGFVLQKGETLFPRKEEPAGRRD